MVFLNVINKHDYLSVYYVCQAIGKHNIFVWV